MISVIICGHNPEELDECRSSIDKTIGVEHEVVVVDNKDNQYNQTYIFYA